MKYLLDTNIVSKLFDKSAEGHIRIRKKIAALNEEDEVAVSILTMYELEYGLANAPEERKEVVRQKIEKVKTHFQTLPIAPEGASRFGELKKALKARRSLDTLYLESALGGGSDAQEPRSDEGSRRGVAQDRHPGIRTQATSQEGDSVTVRQAIT